MQIKKMVGVGVVAVLLSACANLTYNQTKKEIINQKSSKYSLEIRDQDIVNPTKYLKKEYRQELSHSTDWVKVWRGCSEGYIALKKDGSLWQFGEIKQCDWGQFDMIDSKRKEVLLYHLQPKKIGDGFDDAKIISRGNRFYAIKKDGTLWGWGNYISSKSKQIAKGDEWVSLGVELQGHDCCDFDIGLKKDGSLWEIFDYLTNRGEVRVRPIATGQSWDKILIGCCTLYGKKRDGTVWIGSVDENSNKTTFKILNPKGDIVSRLYDYNISNYTQLISFFKTLPSMTIRSNDFKDTIKPREDGTIWFLPEIKYEKITPIKSYLPVAERRAIIPPPPVIDSRFRK